MFILELFWNLTQSLSSAFYIAVSDQYDFLLQQIEKKGFVVRTNIGQMLENAAAKIGGIQR